MEATRSGDPGRLLSRHLDPRDGAFTNMVLFGYVLLATLIAGAASAGAGLAVLAIGLLMVFSLDFVRWRTGEGFAQTGTGRAETAGGSPEASVGPT